MCFVFLMHLCLLYRETFSEVTETLVFSEKEYSQLVHTKGFL